MKIDEFTIAHAKVVFERLVERYKTEPVFVAKVCDDIIDRSGNLLGIVRDMQRTLPCKEVGCVNPHEKAYRGCDLCEHNKERS